MVRSRYNDSLNGSHFIDNARLIPGATEISHHGVGAMAKMSPMAVAVVDDVVAGDDDRN